MCADPRRVPTTATRVSVDEMDMDVFLLRRVGRPAFRRPWSCISVRRTQYKCIIYTVSRLSTVFFPERYGGTEKEERADGGRREGDAHPRRHHAGVRAGRSGASAPQ